MTPQPTSATKSKTSASLRGRRHATPAKPGRHWIVHLVSLGLVLLVILLFAFIRFRLRMMPLERDEGEYAYAGQLMLQGIPPYQLAYNMKLPGTYAAYALILTSAQTPARIHLGLLLVNAATTLCLFFLARRAFGSLAGVVAAASYALLSTSGSVFGLAAHATHFVVLPAVAGLWLLLVAVESRRDWLLFFSGLLLGLGFVMKQPGIAFALFAGVYLLRCRLQRPRDWRKLVCSVVLLGLGASLPFAVTCLIMWKAGVFQKFWFWTFTYARQYASIVTPAQGWALFCYIFPGVVRPVLGLWIIAAVGLTAILWCRRARQHAFFLLGFVLFSALGLSAGLYFRQHYFILVLPVVSILIGVAVSCAASLLSSRVRPKALAVALPVLLFLAAYSLSIYVQRKLFFRLDAVEAVRRVYPGNPFTGVLSVAHLIEQHSTPDTRIVVMGSEPEVYFYTHRHSATGYIYTYPLMENQPFAAKMQKEMISQIERARPEYLVYVDIPSSWLPHPGADWYILAWTKEYIRDNYILMGIDGELRDEALLPPTINILEPLTSLNVYVFKRKPQ